MRYVLKAWSDDDSSDVYAAIVSISTNRASTFLSIMQDLADLKAKYGAWRISIFDYAPDWYGYAEDLEIVESGGVTSIPEDFKTNASYIRQDATCLYVKEDSIMWSTYEKHTTSYMYTAEITREELEQIIEQGAKRT